VRGVVWAVTTQLKFFEVFSILLISGLFLWMVFKCRHSNCLREYQQNDSQVRHERGDTPEHKQCSKECEGCKLVQTWRAKKKCPQDQDSIKKLKPKKPKKKPTVEVEYCCRHEGCQEKFMSKVFRNKRTSNFYRLQHCEESMNKQPITTKSSLKHARHAS
jgi:ABC-type nickel/cobalt efflux system permease component RcnA